MECLRDQRVRSDDSRQTLVELLHGLGVFAGIKQPLIGHRLEQAHRLHHRVVWCESRPFRSPRFVLKSSVPMIGTAEGSSSVDSETTVSAVDCEVVLAVAVRRPDKTQLAKGTPSKTTSRPIDERKGSRTIRKRITIRTGIKKSRGEIG